MTDLLELLDDLDRDPDDVLVHAIRPNMWAACGWCTCGCAGRKRDTYKLRMRSTEGVTCTGCLTEMEARPWPAP